jgi:hypothetical protein
MQIARRRGMKKPGGNVTGIYTMTEEMNPKRLALLKEAVPQMQRVGGENASRRDASERIGQRPRNRDRRISEGRRGREPVGRRNVEADCLRDRIARRSQATENDENEPKGCYELGKPL